MNNGQLVCLYEWVLSRALPVLAKCEAWAIASKSPVPQGYHDKVGVITLLQIKDHVIASSTHSPSSSRNLGVRDRLCVTVTKGVTLYPIRHSHTQLHPPRGMKSWVTRPPSRGAAPSSQTERLTGSTRVGEDTGGSQRQETSRQCPRLQEEWCSDLRGCQISLHRGVSSVVIHLLHVRSCWSMEHACYGPHWYNQTLKTKANSHTDTVRGMRGRFKCCVE